MARLLLFLALLAASATAVQPKAQPSLRVPGVQEERVVFVPVPVEVLVPVPVFVVEDHEQAQDPTGSGVSPECQKEMQTKMPKTQAEMAKAQACEQKEDSAKKAIAKLQDGDVKGAESDIVVTFNKCAGLTKKCAMQIAPSVVMKIRLSGMAVEPKCLKVAEEEQKTTKHDEKWKTCQKGTIKGMVSSLQKQDVNGAMVAAQEGLGKCHKIRPPCDFQLAPMLVMQLLKASQQQQQAQEPEPTLPDMPILLAGVDNALRLREELAPEAPASRQHSGRAISLLNVATRLHMKSERRAVHL